jgi:NADH-ubiquinone oxidoreductase chain 5
MGGLSLRLRFTFFSMSLGSLSLIGLPYLAGFYSKDYVIESCILLGTFFSRLVFIIGCLSVLLTALYSIRLLLLVFLNKPMEDNTFNNQRFKKIIVIADVDNIIIILTSIFYTS